MRSRLFVGTGKYATLELMRDCLEASGAEVVTVAVRRERLFDREGRNLLDFLDPRRYTILPNTAGCFSAEDALRTARLGRELLLGWRIPGPTGSSWKCWPTRGRSCPTRSPRWRRRAFWSRRAFRSSATQATIPVMARRLKEAGATSVMPAGSPIGSGQGVLNPNNIRIILEDLKDDDPAYPVIVDAGVGTASDVTIAMELGCDGVLLNTGIAGAADPLRMAHAMRLAVESGWLAAGAGRIPRKLYATASSPTQGTGRVLTGDVTREASAADRCREHRPTLDVQSFDPRHADSDPIDPGPAAVAPALRASLGAARDGPGGRARHRAARATWSSRRERASARASPTWSRRSRRRSTTRRRSSSRPTRSRFRSNCSTRTSRSSSR